MRLNSSKARSFAETLWGRGGTNGYRTNRKGAYYYSCSGHGGYVVDAEALTPEERANIDVYVKAEKVFYADHANGKNYFLQNPFSVRRQRYHIYPDTVTGYTQVYVFEEDCDWAVLEKFTDIRTEGVVNPEARAAAVEPTFERWHKGGPKLFNPLDASAN